MVLNKPFIQEYLNQSSYEYKELAFDAEQQLSYYINAHNDTSIVGLRIVKATEGSVILEVW